MTGMGVRLQNITAMSIGGSDQCVIVPAGHHVEQAGGGIRQEAHRGMELSRAHCNHHHALASSQQFCPNQST
jgi:hypothetical protein